MELIDRVSNENTVDYKILVDIYLMLGKNLLSDSNHKFNYDTRYIFRSHVPDFITNNEDKFINEESEEYKEFIKFKIQDYINNQDKYVSKPSFHIIFKLHELFPKSYSILIMYNQMYGIIKSLTVNGCMMRFKHILIDGKMKILKSDVVFDSCLYHAYNIIGIHEHLEYYIKKVFMCREYKLLISELEYLDSYGVSNNHYNNLKWIIFMAVLNEAIDPQDDIIEFDKIIDITQVPPFNSIKFTIYMSWYLLQKLNNKDVPIIDIPDEYLNVNINKIYKYFIVLDTITIKKIIKWISDFDFNSVPDTFTAGCWIDTIFNSDGQFYKANYDYIDNPNYTIRVINNKYKIIEKTILINSDNFFDDLNFDDSNNSDNEVENSNNTSKLSNINVSHVGGTKINGFYKFKISDEIINIITPLPFCKMSYLVRRFI